MIIIDLCCSQDHRFEGWFGSAEAFNDQHAKGQVACPTCGATTVQRLPSAPYVRTGDDARPAPAPTETRAPELSPESIASVIALLRNIGKTAEDVGGRFPEEARRIHYGESEARSIRGAASRKEASELLDEGIMILPLPLETICTERASARTVSVARAHG